MFGSEDIRDEGIFSLFSDSPQLGAGESFAFDTFLVAQDLTAGDFTGEKFSVLAGFNWTYTGGTDVSTVGTQITVNQTVIDGINTTLGNEENDKFDGWTALTNQKLRQCVPESSTLASFLVLGILGAGSVLKRQLRQHSTEKHETAVGINHC